MKTIKVALLATAALAAVSVSARADETSDLKAQLAALNARVAQLEAAPAAPAGYSLLTVNRQGTATVVRGVNDQDARNFGAQATVIGVLPTADAPPSTTVEWSGYVRAAIVVDKRHGEKDNYGGEARGELKVLAKTDTSVGEVGAYLKLRGDYKNHGSNADAKFKEYWGYWNMTPEFVLGGGYAGTLGNVNYGYDGACTCYYTDNADAADFNPGDTAQMRLTYVSGPFEMAIALEDATRKGLYKDVSTTAYLAGDPGSHNGEHGFWGDHKAWGAAGRITYAGEYFSGQLSGLYHRSGKDDIMVGPIKAQVRDSWQVAAGGKVGLGDVVDLSLAAAIGRLNSGQKFWGVSGLISAEIDDAIRAEVGVAYKHYKKWTENGWQPRNKSYSGLAGLYYDPVDQLTIGLEGEIINPKGKKNNRGMVDFVTVFRF